MLLSPKITSIVTVSIYVVLQIGTCPLYVVNKLGMKFSDIRNKTLLGYVPVGDRENVERISFMINKCIFTMVAFVVVVICTVTLAIKLQNSSQWSQSATSHKQFGIVSKRNQKVAKTVMVISTLFIFCFVPFCITLLAAAFEPELTLGGKHFKVVLILCGIGFVMESINSSTNIFIYYYMSSKYRDIFLSVNVMFRLHLGILRFI